MKFKHVLIIFLAAMILIGIGSLYRIQSWEGGYNFMLFGYALNVIAVLCLIVKLILFKDENSILNK